MSVRQSGLSSIGIGTRIFSGTAGSVLFVDASGNLGQDNAALFWDITNDRLGIGTTSPFTKFDVLLADSSVALFRNSTSITAGKFAGIGIGYAETGPTYLKSMIVQEQIGDNGARGTIHILNNGANNGTNATLADARLSITYAGNVGIGTTSPSQALQIKSSNSSPQVRITNNDGYGFGIGTESGTTPKLYFATHTTDAGINSDKMVLDFSGKVGIGTTEPGYPLDVVGIVKSDSSLRVFKNGSDSVGSGAHFYLANTAGTRAWAQQLNGSNGLDFWRYNGSAWAQMVTIDTSGNVGIGKTSPASKLAIHGAGSLGGVNGFGADNTVTTGIFSTDAEALNMGSSLGFGSSNKFGGNLPFMYGVIRGAKESPTATEDWAGYLAFYTQIASSATDERMRISSTGNVGIGTTSPTVTLDVQPANGTARALRLTAGTAGSNDNTQLIFGGRVNGDKFALGTDISTNDGSQNFQLYDLKSSATRLTVNNLGNVGIGTIDPGQPLDITAASAKGLAIRYGGDAASRNWGLVHDVSVYGDFAIRTSSAKTAGLLDTARMYFDPSGNVGVGYEGTLGGKLAINGNVGIGTAAPQALLDVQGAVSTGNYPTTSGTTQSNGLRIRLSSLLAGGNGAVLDIGHSGASAAWLQSTNRDNLSVNYPLLLNPNGGNVGIGTTESMGKFAVVTATAKTSSFDRIASFRSSEALASYPLELEIDQIGSATASLQGIGLQTGHYGADFVANLVLQANGGNVGIGTAAPGRKLEVYGGGQQALINSTSGAGSAELAFATEGSIKWRTGYGIGISSSNFEFYNTTNSTVRMVIQEGGNVGIGTTAPDKALEINSATGANLRLTYNDSNGSAVVKADFDVSSTGDLTITCPTDKTVVLGETVWDDFPPNPIIAAKLGSTAPTLATFVTDIEQFTFDASNDYVIGSTEIPHNWKEGTVIYPHIHWATNGSNVNARGVQWQLKWSVGDPIEVFSVQVTSVIDATIAANTTDRTHFISEFGTTMDGANLKIGAVICWRLDRIATAHANGAPTADPFALSIGFHGEMDTIGSRGRTTK